MRVLGLVWALGMAGVAWGQGAPAEGGAPALGGPRVESRAARATLVERDFMGKTKRLEEPPEEAALRTLTLDEGTKGKVNAIVRERAKIMDTMVRENLGLIVNVKNASESGDKAELVRLLGQVREKLAPLTARGTMLEELRGVLTSADYASVEGLVKEYRSAVMEDLRAEGGRARPAQLAVREGLVELGQEIKRSYERQFSARAAEFEKVLSKLDLRPEQEQTIRTMVHDHFQETMGRATPQQNRVLFVRILGTLNREQQVKLLQEYSGALPE